MTIETKIANEMTVADISEETLIIMASSLKVIADECYPKDSELWNITMAGSREAQAELDRRESVSRKDSELVRLEAKVAQYQSDLDKADAQVKIACNEYDAVKANKNVSPDDLDDAGYNLVKADDRRTIINNLLCDAERNLAKYKVVGKIGTPNINPYSPNLRDELAAHVSKTTELIGDLRIKLHEEKDEDTRTILELAIESLERNELSDATCWCVRFDRIGENFSGDERAALEAEFREELAKRFGIEKPKPPTDNEPKVTNADEDLTFYDAQIHSYDDDFVSEQFDNPIDAYKWLEKKIKQSYALERGTRQIEFYGKDSYKVIYRYIPDCRELFIDDTQLENFITNRTPKFTYRTKRGKIRTLKIGETNWAENRDSDDDTSDDDFGAKLAELETKRKIARKFVEEKLIVLDEAQNACREAHDSWCETNYAIDRLYTEVAKNLSEKLLPLPSGTIELKSPKYPSSVVGTDTLRIRRSNDNGICKFNVRDYYSTLGTYDTPAQVETVINQLKAAITRGDKEFTFPTVDDLNQPTENPSVENLKDSLGRAMAIAHQKFHEYEREDNQDGMRLEIELYSICADAINQLKEVA